MKKLRILLITVIAVLLVGFLILRDRLDIEPPEPAERTLVERVTLERRSAKDSLRIIKNEGYRFYQINRGGTIGEPVNTRFQFVDAQPANGQMSYFAISKKDTIIVAERKMPAEEASNIRDIGGLFTEDGYQVKWGKLFRADQISSLNEDDFELLDPLGIQTIVDFRSSEELKENPDTWPNLDQIDWHHLAIGEDSAMNNKQWLEEIKKDDFNADSMMYEANRGFVEVYAYRFKEMFDLLKSDEQYPLLYHCTGGKDRTGLASLLILSTLGVNKETAISEYLMTNYYTQGDNEDKLKMAAVVYGIEPDKLRKLMGVKRTYIQGAFDAIEANYGDIESFMCQALGICEEEVEQLKRKLLYGYQMDQVCSNTMGIEIPEGCDKIQVTRLLEGAKNFREVTSPISSNVSLKKGMLFRADALHKLTDEDVAYLEAIDLKTVIDLRYEEEIEEDPDRKIATVENWLNPQITRNKNSLGVPIADEDHKKIRTWFIEGDAARVDSALTALNIDLKDSRRERYEDFALDFTDSYSEFMKSMTKSENFPLVFHCQGGKDRTGFAAALLLKTLGFEESDIIRDYLTTNVYNYDSVEHFYKDYEVG